MPHAVMKYMKILFVYIYKWLIRRCGTTVEYNYAHGLPKDTE